MTPAPDSKDKIARRLAELLHRFNQGQRLDPQSLAEEFSVNLRTIQRDLNQRLDFLGLKREQGLYYLDVQRQGQLTPNDIERFAAVAGLQGLHPRFGTELLKDLLDSRMQSLQIRGHHYEDLSGRENDFQQLKQAIEHRHPIGFRYRKPEGEKVVEGIEPYQLVNQNGIWYLSACDQGALKSYAFTKISGLLVAHDRSFAPDPTVVGMLAREDSIWLNLKKTEVVLKINKEAADYFRRRKLIDGQKVEKELADGGLLVSCLIAHPNQILSTVRYWLPSIRVISPEALQGELERQLRDYLGLAG